MRLASSSPFSVARTLLMGVGPGIRLFTGSGCWMKLCTSTVIRPPDAAAYVFSSASIQSRAAPMPRTGSSCDDSVWRVPNDASLRTVASMRSGSISRRMARRSASAR